MKDVIKKLLNNKSISEIVRYVLVGTSATAFHYIIYYLFLGFTNHNIAFTMGFLLSFTANFIMTSLFTFRVSLSFQRLTGFSISHILNYLIGLGLLNVAIWLGISPVIAPVPVFFVQVPINFLMVRFALKRHQKEGDAYVLFLSISAILSLGLFLLYTPTLSDDMIYRFMFQYDEHAAVLPITSLGDLLQSQYVHYLTINGRFLIHLIAQGMLVFVPSWVVSVLNAILFGLLVHLFTQWMMPDKESKLFVAAMLCFLLMVVIKGVGTVLFWSLGSFNYLWVLVATLALMLHLRRIKDEPVSRRHIFLSVVAFFVGWSHEGLSLPIAMAMGVYIWNHHRQLGKSALLPYLLFYILGTMMIIVSPALWYRASAGITPTARLLAGIMNFAFNMRVVWLLLLTVVVLWYRKRETVVQEWQQHRYLYMALVMSMGIVFLCGTNLDRVPFFAEFLATMLWVSLLWKTLSSVWQRWLTLTACVLLLLLYIPVVIVVQDNHDVWNDMEQQMKTPGQEVIAVKNSAYGEQPLMNLLASRFVNPTADFGFYCSYMGFDASDSNMRCAARLYGKEKMIFLPEDVVERIKTDSTAYTNYEQDCRQKLFVWQVPAHQTVSRLTFLLKDEDVSALWPHQRLLAYQDDTYELDDFHYEVVEVDGRYYLVFTRPTTNIMRRLERIEYE